MTTTAKPASMRDAMPETADFVDRKSVEWGRAHVRDCIERALRGEPGWFYAMEAGHVRGTPFIEPDPVAEWQRMAVLVGASFAAFMREPEGKGGSDGAAA